MDRYLLGALFWIGVPCYFFPDTVGAFFLALAKGVGLFAALIVGGFLALAALIWGIVYAFNRWRDKRAHAKYLEQDRLRDEANRRRQREAEEQEKWRRQNEERERTKHRPPPYPETAFRITSRADALAILDLKEPFTPDELKTRWRDLLKQTHPDQGGSNMVLRLVNEAYDYLKGGAG